MNNLRNKAMLLLAMEIFIFIFCIAKRQRLSIEYDVGKDRAKINVTVNQDGQIGISPF